MRNRRSITQERLQELFQYDAMTGAFTRRKASGPAKAGSVAGYLSGAYWKIAVDGLNCYAHHLAWLYVYGLWPGQEIDHRDGVESNNAIGNLRLATSQQNKQNRGVNSNNLLGIKGVSICRKTGRYRARIGVGLKTISLGRFDTPEAAKVARQAAERVQFGEFSRTQGADA